MDGKMGACPEWYDKIQIARYLGIPVPEIINVPIWWIEKAVTAMNAEAEAAKIKSKHK